MSSLRKVKGAPIIRHTVCEAPIVARRLHYRRGRLNIEPFHCPRCRETLTEFNIESVNESAHHQLVIAGVEKEVAL